MFSGAPGLGIPQYHTRILSEVRSSVQLQLQPLFLLPGVCCPPSSSSPPGPQFPREASTQPRLWTLAYACISNVPRDRLERMRLCSQCQDVHASPAAPVGFSPYTQRDALPHAPYRIRADTRELLQGMMGAASSHAWGH